MCLRALWKTWESSGGDRKGRRLGAYCLQFVKCETSVVAALTVATIALGGCGQNSASQLQKIEKAVIDHAEVNSIEFRDHAITRLGTRACVSWETPSERGIAQLARSGEQWLVLRLKQYSPRQCESHLVSRLDRRSEAYVELYYLLERGRVANATEIRKLFSRLKGIDDLEYVNPALDEELTQYIEEIVRLEKSVWKAKRASGSN